MSFLTLLEHVYCSAQHQMTNTKPSRLKTDIGNEGS